jgi:histidinol-phosphatase
MHNWEREVEAGLRIARGAGEIALRYFRTGLGFEAKPDDSPVTVADRESERYIASALEEIFPEDGLLGEEGSEKASRSGRRWIIDPIDGTRDFVRGSVAWAILLALEADGEVVAGFSYLPAMGDFFHAARGSGAFRNGQRIHVSAISDPAQAVICLNGFNSLTNHRLAEHLLVWLQPFWAVRSMGGCLDAMLVAQGQADLWLELSGKPWDFAPLKILAEEAGGRFFDFAGRNTIYGGNCVISTPGLEEAARRFVSY